MAGLYRAVFCVLSAEGEWELILCDQIFNCGEEGGGQGKYSLLEAGIYQDYLDF